MEKKKLQPKTLLEILTEHPEALGVLDQSRHDLMSKFLQSLQTPKEKPPLVAWQTGGGVWHEKPALAGGKTLLMTDGSMAEQGKHLPAGTIMYRDQTTGRLRVATPVTLTTGAEHFVLTHDLDLSSDTPKAVTVTPYMVAGYHPQKEHVDGKEEGQEGLHRAQARRVPEPKLPGGFDDIEVK